MKIFVSYPDGKETKADKSFNEIVNYLKKQGHNVKVDLDFRKTLKENDIKSYQSYQSKVEKTIKDVDIVVAEVSNPDAKVGFDVARALDEKKVVIGFEKESKAPKYHSSLHGNKARTLVLSKYNDKNFKEVTDSALEEAKKRLDTKFILIISAEIDRYLDWASQTKRMHKAQIVRNAVEAVMSKDKEYKAYLE